MTTAFVTGEEMFGYRTSNHCSTMQTKLVVMLAALLHAQICDKREIVVFTDSNPVLQILMPDTTINKVWLMTQILTTITHMRSAGQTIILAWIPSHVGIHKNKVADVGAKRMLEEYGIAIGFLISLQQLKHLARQTTNF